MIHKKEDTITRLKQTEAALRTSEEKYRSMIRDLSEGFYSVTLDGVLLDHNVEFNRMLGFGLNEDLVGIQLPDFWQNPEDRTVYLEEFMKHGYIKNYLVAAKRTTGEGFFVEANSRLVKDEQGRPSRIDGTFIEVTERVRAQEALRESERRYRNLFDHSLNGFALHKIVLDDAGQPVDYVFLEVNPAFEELTGLLADQVVGRRATEVLPGVEGSPFVPTYGQVASTGEPIRFEQFAPQLGRHYLIAAFSPQKGQFATLFTDITERKRAEEELEQAVRELERSNSELAQFNRLAVGREMRMIELKRQVNELSEEMGREPPYDLSFLQG